MEKVVGVRFKKAGKIYYFSPGELVLTTGDHVVVETARGLEYGTVVVAPKMVSPEEVVSHLKMWCERLQSRIRMFMMRIKTEKEAFKICQQRFRA